MDPNQLPDPNNPLVQLRGMVLNPNPSQPVQTLQNRVGAGSTALPQFQGIAPGNEQFTPFQSVAPGAERFSPFQAINAGGPLVSQFQGPAADVNAMRGTLGGAAQNLTTAPNRGALAADTFDLIRQRSDPAFQQTLRGVGQKAATLGRIGAGMTTNELGDVTAIRERDLGYAQRELANQAAGQELADRLGIVSALGGVQNQLFGQDLQTGEARLGNELARSGEMFRLREEDRGERGAARSAQAQDFDLSARQRGEARGERDTQRDFETGSASLSRSNREEGRGERSELEAALAGRYGLDMNALDQLEGLERGRRNEVRGERDRADTLAEIANDRRIQQQQEQTRVQAQLFNQLMARAGMAGNLGYNGVNPLDAVTGLSGEAGRQGQSFTDSGMNALMNFFLNQAQQQGQPGTRYPETVGTASV